MEHDLENCPFCGCIHIELIGYLLTYRIECKECGASGPKRKTEEASRSMDSYRLQMNKRLLQLEDSVRQVQESNNGAGLTPNSEGYDL
jgi:transcription elongation factor Elf1